MKVRRLTRMVIHRSLGGGFVEIGEVCDMPDAIAAVHIRNGDAAPVEPEEPAPVEAPIVEPPPVEPPPPDAAEELRQGLEALRDARAVAARLSASLSTPRAIRAAFVDLPEASRMSGVPQRTLRRMLDRGDVPGHRPPHARARWQVASTWVLEAAARRAEHVAWSLTASTKSNGHKSAP